MKIKEIRLLTPIKLRALCIQQDWYTHGTNTEYNHLLLDLTHNGMEHMTTEDIEAVALDIKEHSDIDEEQDVCSIMWLINEASSTVFLKEE